MYAVNNHKKHRSAVLNTQEDRWRLLTKLFNHRDFSGSIYLPDEDLYSMTLVGMARAMFEWLGVETDKPIYVDFSDEIGDAAGLYYESDGTHYILVNNKHMNNRYEAASILAHELMHFCLIGEFNFRLDDTLENERLTDMATIHTGLGIVVMNGFEYSSGWATTVIGLMFGRLQVSTESISFGYYKPGEYASMLASNADDNSIPYESFSGHLLPWTRHYLPLNLNLSSKTNRNRSSLVSSGQKQVWKSRGMQLIVIVALIPVAAIFLNWRYGDNSGSSNIPSGVKIQLNQQSAAIDMLEKQYNTCSSDLKAREANVDTTSQASVDSYNSKLAECEGHRTKYNSAVDKYNAEINSYK